MIEHFITFIERVLLPLGGWGIFAASILEEVVAPIPSSMVIMSGGLVFLEGRAFSAGLVQDLLFTIVLPATFGILLGSLPVYFIAHRFGKPAILHWGKYLGISLADIEKFEHRFASGSADELAIFGLRAFPVIPSVVVNALCGLFRVPWKRYLLITFFGTLVRALCLGVLGWQAGNVYRKYAGYIDRFENVGLLVLAIAVLGYVVWKRSRMAKRHRDGQEKKMGD
jgi:membrane protein DedA with SNARE-associated domain